MVSGSCQCDCIGHAKCRRLSERDLAGCGKDQPNPIVYPSEDHPSTRNGKCGAEFTDDLAGR